MKMCGASEFSTAENETTGKQSEIQIILFHICISIETCTAVYTNAPYGDECTQDPGWPNLTH